MTKPEDIIREVARLEEMREKIAEGGRRGGQARSEAKKAASRANTEKARQKKEMYRKFPILRERK